ncbi:MAG: FimV/HubP family polar landmark protein, partial [Gammaproteobacteria bacterium]
PVRSKKIRRVAAENVAIDSSNTIDQPEDVSITDEQSNSTPINEELNQDNQLSEDTESVNSSETEIDDNMSKIDLARALIESGEKDRAKEIIMDIIKTGTSDEAHEAKILNLQIN